MAITNTITTRISYGVGPRNYVSRRKDCKQKGDAMKRFILYSLSAAMAVALGSVARANESYTMDEAQIDGTLLAQSIDENYSEGEVSRFEYRGPDLVGGVLSPDDRGPNNRAISTTNPSDFSDRDYGARRYDPSFRDPVEMDSQMDERDYPTEGTILSPDDQDPYNRAVPGPGRVDEE
jgi:hypothetical protein